MTSHATHAVPIAVGDDHLAGLLQMSLNHEGWDARRLGAATDLRDLAKSEPAYAAVIEAETCALNALTDLRSSGHIFPVVIIDNSDERQSRLSGVSAGGDVLLTQPFSLERFLAHMREFGRRQDTPGTRFDPVLRIADLTLDEDSHEVTRAGRPLHFTRTEFELLRFLMRNPGRVVSQSQILDRVWPIGFDGKHSVVELYISYLRRKIDTDHSPLIRTVRGAGYIIKQPESPQVWWRIFSS